MTFKHILAASALLASAGMAGATTLTFDSAADCSTLEVKISGPVGCNLSSGPGGTSIVASGKGISYWNAVFAGAASAISVDLGDFGTDSDQLFLRAYNAADAMIEEILLDISSQDFTMHTLSLSSSNVAWVSFGVTADLGTGSGIYADNLSFRLGPISAVPLPAAGWLMLGAMAGIGALARRKRV